MQQCSNADDMCEDHEMPNLRSQGSESRVIMMYSVLVNTYSISVESMTCACYFLVPDTNKNTNVVMPLLRLFHILLIAATDSLLVHFVVS